MSAVRLSRPGVLRDIPLDRHAVIDASAGTGKTFTLEHLVVELLLAVDVTIDRLLILTFTDKATHELRTRVRAKLEEFEAGRGGRTDAMASADAEAGADADADEWVLDSRARSRLARAIRAFDGATITTIHAFCERILRENAFSSGRLFDERPIDGRDAFGRAVRDTLRREAVDPNSGPWLDAALRSGWSVPSIDGLLWECTQAHGPMRPELDLETLGPALLALPVDDIRNLDWAAELRKRRTHSSTARSLQERLQALATIAEDAQRTGDIAGFVLEADRVKVRNLIEPLGSISAAPGTLSEVCAAVLALSRSTPTFCGALVQVLLPAVERAARRSKRDGGRYDFDDMLSLVDEALQGAAGQALAREMRRRWRYVLIDEFQDTDETQWSIFRRAFVERGASDPPGAVFLVGDPKQSIYRFRGADVQTYLRARDEILASGGKCVTLRENYRATAALVEATNELFDPTVPSPVLSSEMAYRPITCGRPERALLDGDGKRLSPVHVLRFQGEVTYEALGAAIARETLTATDVSRPWKFDGRPLTFRDVFVLTRSAREGRAIGNALRDADVPYAFFKEEGLFQSDQAKDLRVLLAAIADPEDRACRVGAWLTPFFGLELAALERARDLPIGHPFVERLRSWKALGDERCFEKLFESIVYDSGVLRREIFFADGERALTNTMHILEILLERTREGHTTLRDLNSELGALIAQTRLPAKLEGNVQRLDGERSAVQIMTIHKSKGLEAPLVFVAGGFARGRTDTVRIYHERGSRVAWAGDPSPEVKPLIKREEADEDERLMYVALTRAMGRLVLPCALDEGATAKRLLGPYDRVNRRVFELVDARSANFTATDVDVRPKTAALDSVPRSALEWRPPSALLRDSSSSGAYESLRASRSGAVLTSYTRMMAGRLARPAGDGRERNVLDAGPGSDRVLRAGRTSGVFLHELLELAPLTSLREATDFDAWRDRADVRDLFDETLTAHRIGSEQRGHAERLIWSAYTTPIALPSGERMASLASAELVAREMKFVYSAGSSDGGTRTFVRGAIDLAFAHGPLTYLLDWKSDTLRSYDRETLARHVHLHYFEQMKLYTLAVMKLLGIRDEIAYGGRFGGLLHCFVRGFDPDGRGLWYVRPSWNDVLTWNAEVGGMPEIG